MPLPTFGWGNRQIAPVVYPVQWLGAIHRVAIRFLDPTEDEAIRAACPVDRDDHALHLRTNLIAAYVVSVDNRPLLLSDEDRLAWADGLPDRVAGWIAVAYEQMGIRRIRAIQAIHSQEGFRAATVREWRRLRDTSGYSGRLLTIEESVFVEYHLNEDERDRIDYDAARDRRMAQILLLAHRGTPEGINHLQEYIAHRPEVTADVKATAFEREDAYFGRPEPTPTDAMVEKWRSRWGPQRLG